MTEDSVCDRGDPLQLLEDGTVLVKADLSSFCEKPEQFCVCLWVGLDVRSARGLV